MKLNFFFFFYLDISRYKLDYQLDFLTPGSSPAFAFSRKQILQIPNFPKNPLVLPHTEQQLNTLVASVGFLPSAIALRNLLLSF